MPSRRPDEYERGKDLPRREADRTPEENVAALNYAADEPEEVAGEMAREAWAMSVAVATGFALLTIMTILVFGGARLLSSWQLHRGVPLQRAAAEGNLGEMQHLLDRGADPNHAGSRGELPLTAAVRTGRMDAVNVLLEAGAMPRQEAIDVAVRYGRREALIALIEAGGDPNSRSTWGERSLLETATDEGDVELVKLLLEHGADPDVAPDEIPPTPPPLVIAARKNRVEIARVLLEHGADPMTRHGGWIAEEIAAQVGNDEIARMIREAAASDETGQSGRGNGP